MQSGGMISRPACQSTAIHSVNAVVVLRCIAPRPKQASELGWTYSALMRRFVQPFPGHSHTHLSERVLTRALPMQPKQVHPSLFPDPGDESIEDLILIEEE